MLILLAIATWVLGCGAEGKDLALFGFLGLSTYLFFVALLSF